MHDFSKICLVAVAAVFLTFSLAPAKSKIVNKDTAKNRQDNVFGTDQGEDTATTTIEKNEAGDTVIKQKARPKEEPVDWYDKIIITVDPKTKWPDDHVIGD